MRNTDITNLHIIRRTVIVIINTFEHIQFQALKRIRNEI